MDKANTKIIIILMAGILIFISGWHRVLAQGQTDASANAVLPQVTQAQFQDWLKNNGQEPFSTAIVSPNKSAAVDDKNSPVVQSVPMTYSQSQNLMLKAAPSSLPPSTESTEAFNAMMQQNAPLTPQQVVKLRQLIDESQRAAAISPTVPPKPVSSTIMINLAPGATPPAIRLAQRHITTLVFVDSTGSPWPVAAYDIGDPKAMGIQWDGKSNIISIQALSPYDDSDLVVRLAGLPTPITLELVPGQRVVDARTDIHVPGIGPNSKDLPTGTGLPNNANQLLLDVLDGIAPAGSKQLTIQGGDCQGWSLGDKMYLRSRLTVLSPGWIGRMKSPDGMIAYEIQQSSSVLISQYGQPVELKIEGF
jgi:intracellular multiplication protein IcmK